MILVIFKLCALQLHYTSLKDVFKNILVPADFSSNAANKALLYEKFSRCFRWPQVFQKQYGLFHTVNASCGCPPGRDFLR